MLTVLVDAIGVSSTSGELLWALRRQAGRHVRGTDPDRQVLFAEHDGH